MEIKGQKFQIENAPTAPVTNENEIIGFKCLHYSVSESAKQLTVTIVKKSTNAEFTFGVRTLDKAQSLENGDEEFSTATDGKDSDGIPG